MKKKAIQTLTRTALLLAVLIALQWATKSLGQLVTGSCVNTVLALGALFLGLPGGLALAVLSPFCAFLLGIGPAFFPLVPFIALGNAVYVLVLALLVKKPFWRAALGIAAGSLAKFLTLYLTIVVGFCQLASLKPQQIQVFSAMFSYPQLITALIGGILGTELARNIKQALQKSNH